MTTKMAWRLALFAAAGPLFGLSASAQESTAAVTDPPKLVVADGQLKSHPFQVFVTHHITRAMNPTLHLTGMHWLTQPTKLEAPLTPRQVLPRQHRMLTEDGISFAAEGTLLVFDVSWGKIDTFKSAARFWPMLEWTEPAAGEGQPAVKRFVATESEVYLGNMPGAAMWTIILVGAIALILLHWSAARAAKITRFPARAGLLLVTGELGFLSLWRAQLMLWTFAVGGVVFLFGLLRLKVPEIPDTLVALMGMSLLTGSLSSITGKPARARTKKEAGESDSPVAAQRAPAFNHEWAQCADLISVWNKTTKQLELSVPKAQMVFWTVVVLALFVVKSILLGALWPVPWELVALTGMSQAGYVGDKFVQSRGQN